MKISIQMYSLREEIKNEGLEAVLGGLRTAGADGVEITADNYGLSLEQFRALLDKYSLAVTGSHTGLADLENHPAARARSKVLGIINHIVPWLSPEDLKINMAGLAARLNATAAFCKKYGMRLGYHNHSHEFADGSDHIAELMKRVPDLKFEPDIFWLAAAGKSAAAYLKPYEKRLLTIHLKELSKDGVNAPNPVFGEGVSEIKQCVILAQRLKLGCVVIEAEGFSCPWREYIGKAVEYIKSILVES